ncbi:transmembrane protease serine 12-like isoform X1 [Choristoneura fumiferana]|uniref:transmembrane protease serine 12-like isoform X1 n=1 Tax=Choristoneura fumiferana TaxID=7141 RepID=UPI003D15539D
MNNSDATGTARTCLVIMNNIYRLFFLAVAYGLSAVSAQDGENGCVLPAYPPHGNYTVDGRPEAVPGQTYDFVSLTVTCDPGYGVVGSNSTYCYSRNVWQPMPQCIRFCRLTPHPSVKYYCKITGEGVVSGIRECRELEPHGTVVVPECNRPVYYFSGVLPNMHCVEGTWDYIAVCQTDCGTSTPRGEPLIYNGERTPRGELPWHAGIYDKTYRPYMQFCGGSLISTKVLVSAAHCFWREGQGQQEPASYSVALGKIYRLWDDAMVRGAHKSDVEEIKIPDTYSGEERYFQDDIALVFMSTPVVYTTYIRPVCVDFGAEFDKEQLRSTNKGTITGWGRTSEDGVASQVLQTAEMPYVDKEKCIADVAADFKLFITVDKLCAGNMNGTGAGVCTGDSGGGLVFPSAERGTRRYYLRGVASAAPRNEHACNVQHTLPLHTSCPTPHLLKIT